MARRRLPGFVAIAVGVLVVAAMARADERTETQRWAVVAANGLQEKGLVDLLTAKLSQDESFQLVERADVARVLDELSLQASGLVDPKQAVKFGGILSATAILIVEKATEGDDAWLHARLVETKSGIRLWSGFVPQTDDDAVSDGIVSQLRTARQKMETDGERRYVGILEVKSEDLDGSSDIFAATIRLMLEHDLQQSPRIVVLEREQASRLLEERDLTGIEVELRAATTLIEGGVRRAAASGQRTVSLRFISPATGVAKSISIVTEADDWDRTRRKVSAECLGALTASRTADTGASRPDEATHGAEAALFRIRAEWRSSHREIEAAAALAEVAFALEPSLANCHGLTSCYARLQVNERRDTMSRLQAGLRYHQVAGLYLRQGIRSDSSDGGYRFRLLFGGNYKPVEMNSAEQGIFEETRRLRRSTFERELAARRADGEVLVWFYVNRIAQALYMTDSAQEFMDDLRVLITELDCETTAGRFERTMANGYFLIFFENLQQQIELAEKLISDPRSRSSGLVALPGDWGPQGIQPLLEWLVQHEDPRTRMLGYYGLCGLDGEPGASAAETVLDMWINDLAERDSGGRLRFSPLVSCAVERLREEGRFVQYVEQRIQAAEQSGDVAYFCKWNSLARICRLNMHPQKTTQWCERIKQFLDAHQVTDQALAGRARDLSRELKMDLDRRYRRGDFAPKTDAGWAGYNVWRLSVRGQTGLLKYLLRVAVDQDPKSDHPIVAVWRSPQASGRSLLEGSRIIVTRLGRRGGELVEVGRFRKPGFSPTCITVGGGDVFLGERTLGIAQVGPQGVRYFDQRQGLPESQIECLAWLEPYLYVAYAGAIGRLDPRSGEFFLLASSRNVQPECRLDGGMKYEVRSLLSDPANDCIWICIYEPTIGPDRSGIWKYTPDTGDFQHLYKDIARYIARADEGLLFLAPKPASTSDIWRIFNTQTGDCHTLDGIGWFIGEPRQPPGWGYLDGGVIGNNGSIYLADGKSYRHVDGGWTQPIDQLGRGLVAVSFDQRAFWYIEPKAD